MENLHAIMIFDLQEKIFFLNAKPHYDFSNTIQMVKNLNTSVMNNFNQEGIACELKIIDSNINSKSKVKISILGEIIVNLLYDSNIDIDFLNLINNRLIDSLYLTSKTKRIKIDLLNKRYTDTCTLLEDILYMLDPRVRFSSKQERLLKDIVGHSIFFEKFSKLGANLKTLAYYQNSKNYFTVNINLEKNKLLRTRNSSRIIGRINEDIFKNLKIKKKYIKFHFTEQTNENFVNNSSLKTDSYLNLDFSLISTSENISNKKISLNNETHNTLTDMKKIEKLQIHNQINTHLTKFKSGENKDSSLTRNVLETCDNQNKNSNFNLNIKDSVLEKVLSNLKDDNTLLTLDTDNISNKKEKDYNYDDDILNPDFLNSLPSKLRSASQVVNNPIDFFKYTNKNSTSETNVSTSQTLKNNISFPIQSDIFDISRKSLDFRDVNNIPSDFSNFNNILLSNFQGEDVFDRNLIKKQLRGVIIEKGILLNNKGHYEDVKYRGQIALEVSNNFTIKNKTLYLHTSHPNWGDDSSFIKLIPDHLVVEDQGLGKYKLNCRNVKSFFRLIDYNINIKLIEPAADFKVNGAYKDEKYKLEIHCKINEKFKNMKSSQMIIVIVCKSAVISILKATDSSYVIDEKKVTFTLNNFNNDSKFMIGLIFQTTENEFVEDILPTSNTAELSYFNEKKQICELDLVKKCNVEIRFIP